MLKDDQCKGCLSNRHDDPCGFSDDSDSGSCPCTTCLVKVMCNYVCDELSKYSLENSKSFLLRYSSYNDKTYINQRK